VHDASDVSPSSPGLRESQLSRRENEAEAAAWCRLLEALEPSLAHDLRGPLNTLTLHVELLRRVAATLDPNGVAEQQRQVEKLQRSVQSLEREVGRLTSHVDGLLRLVGAPQEPPASSTLGALLEECQQDLRTVARHREIALHFELRADSPLRQREVLRRALLLVLYGEIERSVAGDTVTASLDLERDRGEAVLELRSSASDRGAERAPASGAAAEALLARCNGSLSWGGVPGEPALRLRFPVEVEPR
jgi:signal transduction histidine kinase